MDIDRLLLMYRLKPARVSVARRIVKHCQPVTITGLNDHEARLIAATAEHVGRSARVSYHSSAVYLRCVAVSIA